MKNIFLFFIYFSLFTVSSGKVVEILTGHIDTTRVLKLIKQAQDIGFTGLDLNLRGKRESRLIHIDNRGIDFSVPAVWTYCQSLKIIMTRCKVN